MIPEQPETEKKIWVEPELTFMSAKKIRSANDVNAPHEQADNSNDDYVFTDNTGNVGS